MARSVHSMHIEDDIIMTDYVATRWYRAPEILLASNSYSTKVDMWSFGCIIGEILKALFPGNSTLNQLDHILKYFPPCCKEDIQSIKSNFSVSIMSKQMPKIANIGQIKSFVGDNASDESTSMLVSLLKFNPSKRFSALQCLEHPYFAVYRNKKMEIFLSYDVVPPIHDGMKLTIETYRKILFDGSQIAHLQCERRPHEVKIPIKEEKQVKKEFDPEFLNGMY
ncbi:hypothetical protein MXB_384 [Myxobolus squamalis]|nr:hypothetical protein MXB_384 [Myxobolus squamalis]